MNINVHHIECASLLIDSFPTQNHFFFKICQTAPISMGPDLFPSIQCYNSVAHKKSFLPKIRRCLPKFLQINSCK